jgi:RsiW-degrading membrane proteinase PrsW (M82 family)
MTTLSWLAALAPSALLLWYFLSQDLHAEPRGVLLRTFGLGVLITLPILVAELSVEWMSGSHAPSPLQAAFHSAFLTAALCEEGLKFAVVWWYCRRHPAFDEPMDGIVYGVVTSLGFATLENLLYVSDGGLGTAVMRALTAVPAHASWGALMGYFVGQAQFGPPASRTRSVALALGLPLLLHGIYDLPLMYQAKVQDTTESNPALLVVPIAVVWLGWRLVRRLVATLRAGQGLANDGAADPATTGGAAASRWTAAVRPAQGRGLLGVAMMVVGGAVASIGGLVVMAVLAAVASGEHQASPDDGLALGTVIVGGLPLLLGGWLFARGLGRGRSAG